MTTYGTFDIDTVPAPSDIELQALDRCNGGRIGFDHYCHDMNIARYPHEKREFNSYVRRACGAVQPHTWASWDWLWEIFQRCQDARDLADTQRDALR